MAKLINNTGLIADEALTQVSLADWQTNSDALMGQKLELVLKSDETVDLINEGAAQFARISIEFPKFSDGRGYSAARLLREKYGYDGELRAVGDVLIDQLFFMKRCGFDSFALRDDQDLDDAIAAFSIFTVCYQNDANDQRPLFRKRLN